MLYLSLLALGWVVWVVYLAFILLVARVLLGSTRSSLQRLYWLCPWLVLALLAFIGTLALRFAPLGAHLTVSTHLVVPAAVIILVGYIAQILAWGYIFRCSRCGTARSTYRVWWRTGIYRCPNCTRSYVKGKAVDVAV
jgi:hypothetical protein